MFHLKSFLPARYLPFLKAWARPSWLPVSSGRLKGGVCSAPTSPTVVLYCLIKLAVTILGFGWFHFAKRPQTPRGVKTSGR
jgi:hypothetical protein